MPNDYVAVTQGSAVRHCRGQSATWLIVLLVMLGADGASSEDRRSHAGTERAVRSSVSLVTGAEAITYYVAPYGDDANAGSRVRPFRSIARGVSALHPGDTLYIKAGTYAEALIESIPAGRSWLRPVTVSAYPGHTVTLRPQPGSPSVIRFVGPQAYIVVRGLVLDGRHVAHDTVKITSGADGNPAHHIRIESCEIMNAPAQGVLLTRGADHNEFVNVVVHHNGTTDFHHGLYISTANNLVEQSRIFRNAGWGIHVFAQSAFTAHQNIIRGNLVYENGRIGPRGPGILLSSGRGNVAYNNLVWSNNTHGIQVDHRSVDAEVYHNVFYANRSVGVLIGRAFATTIRNNIAYGNGSDLQDAGAETVRDHNLVGVDPHFVDARAPDFRLRSGSPAIDAGTPVVSVSVDFAGTRRPQGRAHDIGPFEADE